MGYIPVEEGYWTWYLGFQRGDREWRVLQRNRIQEYELAMFLERGLELAAETCDWV
jgi:hypothetical protein